MAKLINEPWSKACFQIYTGNGKGKTTAALGMALRAAGRSIPVFIGQFMKDYEYGELAALKKFEKLIHVKQLGSSQCLEFKEQPEKEDIDLANDGLLQCKQILKSGRYKIVILDEICVAIYFKLITEQDVISLIACKPVDVELVFTGRYASKKLIELADLVTEMKEIKHPYNATGLLARDGIER